MVSQSQYLNDPKHFTLGHGSQILSHLWLNENIESGRSFKFHPKVGAVNDNIKEFYQALKDEDFLFDIRTSEPVMDNWDQ